jgi:hypothetical protein
MGIAADEPRERHCGDHHQHNQGVRYYQAGFDVLSPGCRKPQRFLIRPLARPT